MESLSVKGEVTAGNLLPSEVFVVNQIHQPGERMFTDRPLAIASQRLEDGSTLYSATWPDSHLCGQELIDFLNVVAPIEGRTASGIQNDLSLLLKVQSAPYFKDLAARHAESFGPTWTKHFSYAETIFKALQRIPEEGVVDAETGATIEQSDTAIFTREQLWKDFEPSITFFEKEGFAAIYNRYDDLPEISEEVPLGTMVVVGDIFSPEAEDNSVFAFYSHDHYSQQKLIMSADAVNQLLATHPEALEELFELRLKRSMVKFPVTDNINQVRFLYAGDSLQNSHQLAEMYARGPLHYDDGIHSFDYILERGSDGEVEFIELEHTRRLVDPRPRMQPVLMWRQLSDGRRVFDNADNDSPLVWHEEGSVRYGVTKSAQLGLLMAFLFMPSFRKDEAKWPKTDSLSADKRLPLGPSMGKYPADPAERELLTTNTIGPANVALQAVRKKHLLSEIFPFAAFEACAIGAAA